MIRVQKQMGRPKKALDSEQRARREVANSNERRRMQCINNGFNCLREILKRHNNIEKQSKAAILHESANYIKKLETDINHFLEQNAILKNFLDTYKHKLAMNKAQAGQPPQPTMDGMPAPPPFPPFRFQNNPFAAQFNPSAAQSCPSAAQSSPSAAQSSPSAAESSSSKTGTDNNPEEDSDKTEEDDTYKEQIMKDRHLPPKKKIRLQARFRQDETRASSTLSHDDKSEKSVSPGASERAMSVPNIPQLQSPESHFMEKEIMELKQLLSRERLLRAGFNDRQRFLDLKTIGERIGGQFGRQLDIGLEPQTGTVFPQASTSRPQPIPSQRPYLGTPPGYTINPIPTFIPVPMQQHLMRPSFNYNDDQPLNLKKTNDIPSDYHPPNALNYHNPTPMSTMPNPMSSMPSPMNPMSAMPPMPSIPSMPITRPKERVSLLDDQIRDKDVNFRRFLHQSISAMNMGQPRPNFPMHFADKQGYRPQAPMPTATSSRAANFRDNLDLIVRAIRHIEGDEVFKNRNGEQSAYMKHLTQNMDISSSSVFQRNQLLLKRLLTNRTSFPTATATAAATATTASTPNSSAN